MGTKSPNNFGYSAFAIFFSAAFFYCSIGNIDAQNIVPFPNGQSITPETTNIADEQIYSLKMTGATTTRVSKKRL